MVAPVTSLGRSGLYDWVVQRASAVILMAYTIFLMGYFLLHPEINYASWVKLFDNLAMRLFTFLAMLALFLHTWVGIWTITTDYLTERALGRWGTTVRLLGQSIGGLIIFIYLMWGSYILWLR